MCQTLCIRDNLHQLSLLILTTLFITCYCNSYFTCQGTQGSGTLSHLPKVKQLVQVQSRGLNLRSIQLHSPNLCDTQVQQSKYAGPHVILFPCVRHKDCFARTEQGDISQVKNNVSSHFPFAPILLLGEQEVGSNSKMVPTSCP